MKNQKNENVNMNVQSNPQLSKKKFFESLKPLVEKAVQNNKAMSDQQVILSEKNEAAQKARIAERIELLQSIDFKMEDTEDGLKVTSKIKPKVSEMIINDIANRNQLVDPRYILGVSNKVSDKDVLKMQLVDMYEMAAKISDAKQDTVNETMIQKGDKLDDLTVTNSSNELTEDDRTFALDAQYWEETSTPEQAVIDVRQEMFPKADSIDYKNSEYRASVVVKFNDLTPDNVEQKIVTPYLNAVMANRQDNWAEESLESKINQAADLVRENPMKYRPLLSEDTMNQIAFNDTKGTVTLDNKQEVFELLRSQSLNSDGSMLQDFVLNNNRETIQEMAEIVDEPVIASPKAMKPDVLAKKMVNHEVSHNQIEIDPALTNESKDEINLAGIDDTPTVTK